jgi:ATP-dependent protease Clp ATPase subunit
LKEKLVSIQQDYIQAFGLQNEFKSRLRVINKQLNFDKDSLTVKLSNGRVYNLEGRGVKLVNGSLVY